MRSLRRLLVFLAAAVLGFQLVACSSNTSTGPKSFVDPFSIVYIEPAFTNAYGDTVAFSITAHVIADPDNPDPASIPPDYTQLTQPSRCTYVFNGNNSRDVRLHVVVTITPVVNNGTVTGGDSIGPVYQSDTLDPSPAVLPFPAPWGLDQDHLLVWKIKLTDASTARPALTPFVTDTILNSNTLGNTPCQMLFP